MKAYKQKSKESHPDKNSSEDSTSQMQMLNIAKEWIGD